MSDWEPLAVIHAKLLGRSNDAVATFWRLVQWARTPGVSARPGFVDFDQIRALAGGISKRKVEKVIAELVAAGKGAHRFGLLDPVEDGWLIHDFEQYGRGIDVVAALAPLPVPATAATKSAVKAAAGRLGGLRSAASRAATKQTAQPPKQAPKQRSEAEDSASKQTESGSRILVGSLSSLKIREITQENPHPKDLTGLGARDVCFEDEDFLEKLSIGERAALITEDRQLASVIKPHRWEEVRAVFKAFAQATGRDRTIVAYDRDTGVQAVVALLAVYDLERLLAIVPKAVTSPWWLEKPGRSISELSLRVVEIAIENDAASARVDAEAKRLLALSTRKTTPQGPLPAAGGAS